MKRLAATVALVAAVVGLAGCAVRESDEEPLSGPTFELALALQSKDPETRANTALVLGYLGDASAIPLLQQERDEPDIRVRFEITAALARLGNEAAQQVIVGWAVNRYAEDQWNAMTVCA